eukprot:SAG11_NODE_2042_length_3888_cov_2.370810_3_plen_91_part_00
MGRPPAQALLVVALLLASVDTSSQQVELASSGSWDDEELSSWVDEEELELAEHDEDFSASGFEEAEATRAGVSHLLLLWSISMLSLIQRC